MTLQIDRRTAAAPAPALANAIKILDQDLIIIRKWNKLDKQQQHFVNAAPTANSIG